MSSRCRWLNDREAGRVHIPGCWGSAVYGHDGCTCPQGGRTLPEQKSLEDQVADLAEKVDFLQARLLSPNPHRRED